MRHVWEAFKLIKEHDAWIGGGLGVVAGFLLLLPLNCTTQNTVALPPFFRGGQQTICRSVFTGEESLPSLESGLDKWLEALGIGALVGGGGQILLLRAVKGDG